MKGISFGNYHSYDDFGLLLSSKEIGSPEPKIITVDVEGGDGVLDFTEFAGETKFRNRSLTFHFSRANVLDDFLTLFSQIHNAIHGQKMQIVLDDDPGFYYVGRITVNDFKTAANIGIITVQCDCDPWKYKQNVTREKVFLYGKNLFDTNIMEQGILQTTVGVKFNDLKSNSTTRLRSKVLQYVKPNTRYTMTIPSGFEGAIRTFDAEERQLTFSAFWENVYSFTTGSSVDSIAVYIKNLNGGTIRPSDIADSGFQIEEGNEATEYEAFLEETTASVLLENLRRSVIPTIHAGGAATISFDSKSIALEYASITSPSLLLKQGTKYLTITGNGAVVFEYQEGGL